MSAVDELEVANMVNFFGHAANPDDIEVLYRLRGPQEHRLRAVLRSVRHATCRQFNFLKV